jgi:hypothetical protein
MKPIVRTFGNMLLGLTWLAALPAAAANAAPTPVAGLAPYQRPAEAPAIKDFARSDAWRAAALRGVTAPAPESILKFLDHQGAWYNPFTLPGMPGPYDLRGRHAPQKAAP